MSTNKCKLVDLYKSGDSVLVDRNLLSECIAEI